MEAAEWVADLLMERYTPEGGLLARRVDAAQGRIVDNGGLVDELGDYAQYVWLVGQDSGRDDLCSWAAEQLHRAGSLYQRPCGLIMRRPVDSAARVEFFNAMDIGDALWGLTELSVMSGDAASAAIRDRLVDGLWRLGLSRGQVAYGAWIRGDRRLAIIPLTEPMTAGYVGEALVNIHLATGRPEYLARAEGLLLPWLSTKSFVRHGLFTRMVTTGLPGMAMAFDAQFRLRRHHGLGVSKLVKGDTYLVMALLALWRVTGDDSIRRGLYRWLEALSRFRLPDGRFANYLDLKTGRRWWVNLGENHSVIEALMDLYCDFEQAEALDLAVNCAEAWLARQTFAGLIPEHDGDHRSFLDPQTDFTVDLFKLAQLTGRKDFADAAMNLLRSVLAGHSLAYGLAQAADAAEGRPIGGEVETKFMGLFLKGLLVYEAYSSGGDLMGRPELRRLCSDR